MVTALAFAGISQGQGHVKVIDGTKLAGTGANGAIYLVVNGTYTLLSSDIVAGPSVQAGKTIRLRIAATNNHGRLIVGVDSGVWRQVPCEGRTAQMGVPVPVTIRETRNGALPQVQVRDITLDPVQEPISGTCQMLVLKLRDGTEQRAKFRFN